MNPYMKNIFNTENIHIYKKYIYLKFKFIKIHDFYINLQVVQFVHFILHINCLNKRFNVMTTS